MNLARAARWLWTHPALLVVPGFVLWSAFHLAGSSWDYDEGAHAYAAWLATQGHPLYTQTFAAYTPGYLVALMGAFQLLGATLSSARFVTVLFAAVGLAGVALGLRVAARDEPFAEWCALLLLCLAPVFFQASRAVLSDAPSGALMALAVGLGLWYWREGGLRWLFAAEAVLAASLWVKLTGVGGALAMAVIVPAALWRRRTDLPRALGGSAIAALAALSPLLFFDVPAMLDSAVFFHLQKRLAFEQNVPENVAALLTFLAGHAPLLLAALWAVAAAHRDLLRSTGFPLAAALIWFVATFATLATQTPLYIAHHPVVLLFPLALMAGTGAAALKRMWVAAPAGQGRLRSRLVPALVAAIVLASLNSIPEQLARLVAPPYNPYADEVATLLKAVTPPQDLLVSDAQLIAFNALRQSPPGLADTSTSRLTSGNLTPQMLIDQTRGSGANAVLFWSGRLESSEPFAQWVRQTYHPVRSAFQSRNAPYTFFLKEAHPQFPLEAFIGDGVRFAGYDLNRRADEAVAAGRPLSVTLYFQRSGTLDQAYTIFLHLLAPGDRLLAQDDRQPLANRYPTDAWTPGEYVIDEFTLALSDELPSGEYRLALGMYRRETLKRLAVSTGGALQPDERLLLPLRIGKR